MTRPTLASLVTEDLGYCCLYQFFRLYRQTGQIADRLGLSRRTVQYHKAAFRAGEFACQCNGKCMKNKRPKQLLALRNLGE